MKLTGEEFVKKMVAAKAAKKAARKEPAPAPAPAPASAPFDILRDPLFVKNEPTIKHELQGKFCKIRFSNGKESTAGIVIDAHKAYYSTISELSRLFPHSEAGKMKRLIVSHPFDTFEEAFNS